MPKRKFSLKSGKTLEYKNGKWYYDGKLRSTKNFTLVDVDGYTKALMPDGTLAVQDVDSKGNSIKPTYIGGTPSEARSKYWEQAPIMRHATDSIAKIYGINPSVLRNRLDREGYTDNAIRFHNMSLEDISGNRNHSNYSKLNRISDKYDGTRLYGLDDVFTYIKQGDVVPIETTYYDHDFVNKKGRTTNATTGITTKDNISLMGATLKYFRDKAEQDFPGANRMFLDEAAGIYFNRGAAGGKEYLKNKKK